MNAKILQTLTLLALCTHCGVVEADSTDSSQEIMSAYYEWVEAVNAKDIEWWASFLDAGAVFLPDGNPALETTDAIIDFYVEQFRDPSFSLDCTQTLVEVSASNDFAWSHGTCNGTFTTPDGELGRSLGKWTKVWVRSDSGEWKCRLNAWNRNE
jgi:ketosteroid isomerase-like protein